MRSVGLQIMLCAAVTLSWTGALRATTQEARPDAARTVEEQRARGEAAGRLLGRTVRTFESKHFIVHTTLDDAEGAEIPKLAEESYQRFRDAMGIDEKDFRWTGKVVVYVLSGGEEFATFSEKAHGYQGGASGAYFRAALDQAELVLPRTQDAQRFKQDLTHEASHLLLHFYKQPGRVPNWLQEGLAQWFEFKGSPDSKAETEARKTVAGDPADKQLGQLNRLLKEGYPKEAADVAGYTYAWSFVDYLMDARRAELVRFMGELKDGADQEQAAKKTFGEDLSQLEKSWVKHVHADQ